MNNKLRIVCYAITSLCHAIAALLTIKMIKILIEKEREGEKQ